MHAIFLINNEMLKKEMCKSLFDCFTCQVTDIITGELQKFIELVISPFQLVYFKLFAIY